ncbi:addiction module toxin RelE [Enterococcus hulanensis]|uniref:addiction module toxin RelE n=1 Tax=Enterococcus hulanensis TaxID=2559929 RepID=UPI0010FA1683|nr:addiction module toxin RelE [Enterococcus hulanensis]MBO0455826.1 addiction module toxin RelE [Enterococcus hulanensis]
MPTKKKRIKVSLSDEAFEQFEWLMEQIKKETKKRVYPGQVFEQMIKNEYTIKRVFRK